MTGTDLDSLKVQVVGSIQMRVGLGFDSIIMRFSKLIEFFNVSLNG